jgi:PAS domain S-box-containing protein
MSLSNYTVKLLFIIIIIVVCINICCCLLLPINKSVYLVINLLALTVLLAIYFFQNRQTNALQNLSSTSLSDIIDHKNTAEAFIESEKKYRLLFENMISAFSVFRIIYDAHGNPVNYRFTEANSAFEQHTGICPKEFIGKTIKELLPENVDFWIQIIEDIALTGESKSAVVYSAELNKHLDTYIFKPEKDKIALVFNDITERVNAENALRISEQRLSDIYNLSPNIIGITRQKDDKILDGNLEMTNLSGYQRDEIIGKTPIELGLWAYPEERKAMLDILKENGEVRNFEFTMRTKEGNMLTCLFSGKKHIYNNEASYLWVINDITKRKSIENALLESESRLRSFINESSEGIVIVDENGAIREWNKSAETITGLQQKEITGKTFWDLNMMIAPESIRASMLVEELKKKTLDTLKSGVLMVPLHSEFAIQHTNGETKYVEQNTFTIKTEKGYLLAGLFSDITERKRAEELIRTSEKRLNKAQIVGYIGYSEQSVNDNKVWASAEGMSIFGFPPVEGYVQIEKIMECIVDLPSFRKAYLELIQEGKRFDLEYAINPADGSSPRFIHAVAEIEKGENGEPIVLTIFQDITKRKQDEAIIRLRESYLTAIIENQPGLLWLKDDKSRFLAVNEAFAKSCGLNNKELLVGKTDWDIWPPELAEKYVADDQSVMQLKQSKIVEEPIFDKGEYKWFETFKTPIVDNTGNVIGTTGYSRDITERKKAEEKFKQLASMHQTILDTVPVGLLYIKDRTTQWTNKAITKIFGYEFSELLGKSASGYYANELDFQEVGTNGYAQLAQGKLYSNEFVGKRKDGSLFWVNLLGKAINPEDISEGSIWIVQDINERKQAEQEIKELNTELEKKVEERTAKLFEANKGLESFAYSISHDLRAPLRHIDGFVRILYSNIQNPTEKITNFYEKINASSKRMSNMIDDLLSFSRLGRKELNISLVNLSSLINEIIEQFKPDITDRKIKWKIQKLPDISCDRNMMKIVFENLISNAIKYTAKEEKAMIAIGAKELKDNKIEIYIRDNGVGFDMVYVDKLFGVFQRLHSSEEFEGTGIGLANVKQIINKHNGMVRAEGNSKEGATFYLTLPK